MEPNVLYDFLIKNRNLKESWDEENRPIGGAEELAQEAARVLVENLEKYKKIIQKLAKEPDDDIYEESRSSKMLKDLIIRTESIIWGEREGMV